MKNKIVFVGLLGVVFSALCCFTPMLAIVLPAIGLGGVLAYVYNDAVLLPMLAIFVLITVYGVWRGRKT